MIKSKYINILVCLLTGWTCVPAQKKHEFTSKQCIEYAKKNNAQIKNAWLDLEIQKQTNREITSRALPSINANGSVVDNFKIATQLLPGEFFGQPAGTFVPVKFGTQYNANGGIELQQILFDGQVFVGLQARQSSIDLRNKNIELVEETIRANIYKIYYQLLVGKNQVDILQSNIDRLAKLEHDTREIYKNGFAEKIDVDKASVQLSNLETEKIRVQNQLETGYLGLKLLMGMPIKDTLILTETITDEKIKTEMVIDSSNYKYIDRKDYAYLDILKKLGVYNIKQYKLSYIPTLTFSGSYNYTAQRTKFNFFSKNETWYPNGYISLRINVPIFDGFSKDAKIKGAKYQLQQTINRQEELKTTIDKDVEQARLNYRSAILTVDAQKRNMALAEQVYNQTKKKYEIGTGSSIEILNAQTDLRQAQTNYINAMYDAVINRVDYMKAIGKLE